MPFSIDTPAAITQQDGPLPCGSPRRQPSQIGARTTLAELLRGLRHAPQEETSAFRRDFTNRRLQRGQLLAAAGDRLESLYVVLSGCFRSILHEVDGSQRVVAFPMRGDLIGLDAIGPGRYPVTISALDEAHAAVIPYVELLELASSCPTVAHAVFAAATAPVFDNYHILHAMGALAAEDRVVRFLHMTGQRIAGPGFPQQPFRLPMTRADIAQLLGLSIESVSRAFTSLAARGLLEVNCRQIRILNRSRLDDPARVEPRGLRAQGCARAPAKAHQSTAHIAAG